MEGDEDKLKAEAGDDQREAHQNQGLVDIATTLHPSPQLGEVHAANLSVNQRHAKEEEGHRRRREGQILDPGFDGLPSIPLVSTQGIQGDTEQLQPEEKRNEVVAHKQHSRSKRGQEQQDI